MTRQKWCIVQPKSGTIKFDEGLNISKHSEEIEMAKFLNDLFGGELTVLKEANIQGVKTADFLWNNKLWDLKTVTTEKSADSAIRKGLKQIKDNPDGIILDYRNREVSLDSVFKVVDGRTRRGIEESVDIMLVLGKNKVKVYRYKKRKPPRQYGQRFFLNIKIS